MSQDPLVDSETQLFAQIWDEALKQCMVGMNEADAKFIAKLEDPSKLADDLRDKEAKSNKPWYSRAFIEVAPTLDVLKHVTQFFLLAMRPMAIEVTLIWGLLYLTIELSLLSEQRWKQMAVMLKRTRRALSICKASTEMFSNNLEMRQALLDVFIALILFWAEASKYMREMNSERVTSLFLESRFEVAMKEMNAAIENLQLCAAIRAAGQGDYRSMQQDHEIAALFPTEPRGSGLIQYPFQHLPYNNDDRFVGRTSELGLIAKALAPTDMSKQRAFTIWGLGGVGKSQLALAYASSSRGAFDLSLWLNAGTEASLIQSFTDIAISLHLIGAARGYGSKNHDLVQSWLLRSGKKWLLIFDDVEDIELLKPYYPSSPGSILITTRKSVVAQATRGGLATKLNVKPFSPQDSYKLFTRSMAWNDSEELDVGESEALELLLEQLGGLPLGICQMASLVRLKIVTIQSFLHRYNKEAGDTRKLSGIFHGPFDQDYSYALETVWKFSFGALEADPKEGAFQLLSMISLLSPDSIPTDLFLAESCPGMHKEPRLGIYFREDDFEDARDALLHAALIEVQDGNLSIHRLVQTAFLHFLGQKRIEKALNRVSILLFEAFPKRDPNHCLFTKWPQCERLIVHAITLAERFSQLNSLAKLSYPLEFVELLSTSARYIHESSDPKQCQKVLTIAREICPDKTSLLFAHILQTFGSSKFEVNNLLASRKDLELALKIRQEKDLEDRVGLANSYHVNANLLSAEGNPAKALEFWDICREVLSTTIAAGDSGALITIYMGCGRAHFLLGNYEKAEEFFKLVDATIIPAIGPRNHFSPHTPFLRGNSARAQGDIQESFRQFKIALDIAPEKTQSHLLRAIHYKLGTVALDLGNVKESKIYLQQAMILAQRHRSQADVARIAKKTAEALIAEGNEEHAKEIERLTTIARSLKAKLEREMGYDVEQIRDETEKAYDRLMCGYFRYVGEAKYKKQHLV